MLSPKPPSISPGENHARSSSTCARTTAPPREPFAIVATDISLMVAASIRAAPFALAAISWRRAAGDSGGQAQPRIARAIAAQRRARAMRLTVGSVVELDGMV